MELLHERLQLRLPVHAPAILLKRRLINEAVPVISDQGTVGQLDRERSAFGPGLAPGAFAWGGVGRPAARQFKVLLMQPRLRRDFRRRHRNAFLPDLLVILGEDASWTEAVAEPLQAPQFAVEDPRIEGAFHA